MKFLSREDLEQEYKDNYSVGAARPAFYFGIHKMVWDTRLSTYDVWGTVNHLAPNSLYWAVTPLHNTYAWTDDNRNLWMVPLISDGVGLSESEIDSIIKGGMEQGMGFPEIFEMVFL